jgi:hypothetical protein
MSREQTGGCCRSSGLGIVALRRSWRDIFLWKTGGRHKERKKEQKRKKTEACGTDAADGNPLRTRIPTAAWKAQNAFHSSHRARRRLHHRIYFSLGRRMGSASNIKTASVPTSNCLNRGVHPTRTVPRFVPTTKPDELRCVAMRAAQSADGAAIGRDSSHAVTIAASC